MRVGVVENGRRRLHLELRTHVWLYAGSAVLLVALGIWCIRLLAIESRTTVENGQLSHEKTCLVRVRCGGFRAAADEVRGVGVVVESRGLWRSHEVQVELPDGAHLLALPRAGGDEKGWVARGIEDALAAPGASFHHEDGATWAGLLLGLVCIAGGLVVASALQTVAFVADRDEGTVVLSRRRMLWPVAHRVELPLGDLQSVDTMPHTLRTGRHIVTSWWLRLRTRDGTALPVTYLPMFTEGQARELASLIQVWMKRAGGRPAAKAPPATPAGRT
jgi:hypothetical protein